MTLPMYMLAMTPQKISGCSFTSSGPGWMPCTRKAPSSTAITTLAGMPSVSSGIIDPPVAALFADSGAAAEPLGMPSDPLLERVGEERRDDRADPGEDAEEEPEDGAARDGPGRGPPLLAVRQEALDPRLEDLLVEALFDVEKYLGDAE